MNKKSFLRLLAIMMVAMLSVSLVSCSSDDDEFEGSGPLGGRWERYMTDGSSQGTLTFIFKNGTVTSIEKWSEPGYDDDIETYTGPYVIEDNIVSMTLTRLRDDGSPWYSDNYVFKFEINGKTLTLTANDRETREYWGTSPMVYTKK